MNEPYTILREEASACGTWGVRLARIEYEVGLDNEVGYKYVVWVRLGLGSKEWVRQGMFATDIVKGGMLFWEAVAMLRTRFGVDVPMERRRSGWAENDCLSSRGGAPCAEGTRLIDVEGIT